MKGRETQRREKEGREGGMEGRREGMREREDPIFKEII